MSKPASDRSPALLSVCAALVILAALYLGRSLVAPVCISIFIVAVAWPLQRALERRVPRVLAMVVTVVATAAVVVVMASLVLWGLSRAAQWAIANASGFYIHYQ